MKLSIGGSVTGWFLRAPRAVLLAACLSALPCAQPQQALAQVKSLKASPVKELHLPGAKLSLPVNPGLSVLQAPGILAPLPGTPHAKLEEQVPTGVVPTKGAKIPSRAYGSRPDILSLSARALESPDMNWEKLKEGKLEALAEILELYPDHEIFFLARDAEYIYDLGRVLLDGAGERKRLHLLNVSRANMRDKNLLPYLEQEGLGVSGIVKGKKVLLVDTGFSGTIPGVINERLPEKAQGKITTKLLASSNSEHGSTRVFLQKLNPSAGGLNPGFMHGTIVAYENMPRFTSRATSFERIGRRWEAISGEAQDSDDGKVDPKQSLSFMRDLRAFGEGQTTRFRFNQLRGFWQSFRTSRSKKALLAKLKAHLKQDTAMGGARVRDLIEHLRLGRGKVQIGPEELGLAALPESGGSNKQALIKKYPQWKSILEDPETKIQQLVQTGDYQTLGSLIDAVHDAEIDEITVEALAKKATSQSASLIAALIKKGDAYHEIIQDVLSKPDWKGHPELVESLIANCSVDFEIATFVLSQPHCKNHPEWVEALIKKGSVDRWIARDVLSQPYWKNHPEWVEALIKRGGEETDSLIIQYVLSKRHWPLWTRNFWEAALQLPIAEREAFLEEKRPYRLPKKAQPAGASAPLPPQRVSLKAKSHEGLGAIGRGEAVACYAVATLLLPA